MTLGTLWMIGYEIQQNIVADYRFEKTYLFAWNLADKSSTIDAKAKYISQFVELLEASKADFSSHDAQWMKTPDNSFEMNLAALKTLDSRLHEIMRMDVKSFEYQTAIQQITAQEQGEAKKLIGTLYGCWLKEKYPVVWDWFQAVWVVLWIAMMIAATIMWILASDDF